MYLYILHNMHPTHVAICATHRFMSLESPVKNVCEHRTLAMAY